MYTFNNNQNANCPFSIPETICTDTTGRVVPVHIVSLAVIIQVEILLITAAIITDFIRDEKTTTMTFSNNKY